MYFKRLELQGFKSFVDPAVIDFDSGITCVVGPNGSGKSNICDAIRWVLGEQSPKQLRGEKMEDVIFAGSDTKKSRGMAQVTLVINNDDKSLPIEYSEVAITRRMYRSGESEYLINNNRCRMKDIRELIMDTGIGVEGYSLIGQGKINDIISNNTESIREILEETAGIVMYRSKKAETERKLAAATSNIERVEDIIGEIEGRIDGLKTDSEKAAEYLDLRERHKELEINIILKNVEQADLKKEYLKDDRMELSQKLEEDEEKRRELAKAIEEKNAKTDELEELMKESREKQLSLIDRINALDSTGRIREARMESLDREREMLCREIGTIEEKIDQEEKSSARLFADKKAIDERYETLSAALREKEKVHGELIERFNEKSRESDERKNRFIDLQGEINRAGARKESAERLISTLAERKEEIYKEKETGRAENEDHREQLEQARKEAAEISEKLEETEVRQEKVKEEYISLTGSEREATRRIEELKLSVGRLEAREKTIKEMEANYEGYGNAVRYLMQQKPKGICGVVAELFQVPEGYETAIETALGTALQNVICDTDEAAKAAIRDLKENKAGRITFLPVGSVKPRNGSAAPEALSAKGALGIASEKIRCEGRYRDIAEYLLGNVVIMEDMDSAVSASKKYRGPKYVTMDGEIINPSGAITGGRYKNKTANILERRAEIHKLAEEIEKAEKEQADLAEQAGDLREKAGHAMKRAEELREEYSRLEKISFEKAGNISFLETGAIHREDVERRREKELENIEEKTLQAQEEMREAEEAARKAEEEKEALSRMLEGLNEETEDLRKRMDEASDGITGSRIDLGRCDSEKSSIDALVEKASSVIEAHRQDLEIRRRRLESAEAEIAEIRGSADSGEEIAASREEKRRVEDYLGELEEEKAQLDKELREMGSEKEELDEAILRSQEEKHRADVELARVETQLDNARNKLWEEFDISFAAALEYKSEDFVLSRATKENREIKNRMKELGEVNVGAIEEYKNVKERYEFLTGQRDDIAQSMKELRSIIAGMDKEIHEKFKTAFEQVVENFESVYRELHGGGGHAAIILEDEKDPFESEIEIKAEPPGKQLKNINLLSGGEKTMTAIALMFAVLKTKPTPCCVLDEVEAALDESNLDIFGRYLKNFGDVQFTLITHQKQTMEHSDAMYGITMPENGASMIYSIKMDGRGGGEEVREQGA